MVEGPEAARPVKVRLTSQRAMLTIGALALLLVVAYIGREALTPFVFGLLFVYLLAPGVELLARRGLPRWLAILVVYAAVAFVLIEGVTLLIQPLVSQLALFIADAPRYTAALRDLLDSLSRTYRTLDLPPEVRAAADNAIARFGQTLASVDPAVLLPVATSLAAFLGNIVGYAIIPVWAFYVLNDRAELRAGLDRFLPPSWHDEAHAIAGIVDDIFGRWLRGQLVLSLVVGVVTFVGLLIIGALVDPTFARLAVLLAVIAAVLEFLPFIGPTLAAIPAALVGLTIGVEATVSVVGLYLGIQVLENYWIVPKIQSKSVSLHPAVVIVALVIGGTIAGFIGAILALPVTAVGKEIYEYLAAKLPDDRGVPEMTGLEAEAPPAAGASESATKSTRRTRAHPR